MFRVAIIGAASLKGKELKEVLEEKNFPVTETKLLDDDESLGQLEALGDEPTFIQNVRAEQFENIDFAFFASDEEFTRKNWHLARKAGCTIIDLSHSMEDEPGVAVRAPWIDAEMDRLSNGRGRGLQSPNRAELDLGTTAVVVAHPAATILALLLLRTLKLNRLESVAATIFQPVSELGKQGMDELHQQTINLLSFQQLPKAIFDTQIAFNMVSNYGELSSSSLERVERRIARHFERVTHGWLPVPSLMLLQTPTFHTYTFSIYLQFHKELTAEELRHSLLGNHIAVTTELSDSPSNVNAAGRDDVMVTARIDDRNKKAAWLWAAADNLKVVAETAAECAMELAMVRPTGKVQ